MCSLQEKSVKRFESVVFIDPQRFGRSKVDKSVSNWKVAKQME